MRNAVFWDVTACEICKIGGSEDLMASIIRETRIGVLGIIACFSFFILQALVLNNQNFKHGLY
jgi:hypothetical protein